VRRAYSGNSRNDKFGERDSGNALLVECSREFNLFWESIPKAVLPMDCHRRIFWTELGDALAFVNKSNRPDANTIAWSIENWRDPLSWKIKAELSD